MIKDALILDAGMQATASDLFDTQLAAARALYERDQVP